ncbi:MAG: tol-pal system protein YbgF [Oceanicaulis sp.]
MLRLIALVLLAAGLAAPAEAQSRRELAARLDAAEARLAEIEAQALAGDPVAETLIVRIDALEREQRVLTGEIERLAFENRQLRTQLDQLQRSVNVILEGGVQTGADPRAGDGPAVLEPNEINPDDPFAEARAEDVQPLQAPSGAQAQRPAGQPANAGGAASSGPAGGPSQLGAPEAATPADPDTLFARGRNEMLEGDFADARDAFESFVAAYPEDDMADEAFYWLGETHFVAGDLDAAADAYIASLQTDRRGERAPDALIKLGAAFAGLGETEQACQVLATFPVEFPSADQDARRKAQREIARIGCS